MNIFKSGFISRWGQVILGLVFILFVAAAPVEVEAKSFWKKYIVEPFEAVVNFVVESVSAVVNAVVYTAESVVSIAANVVTGNFSEAVHETGCLVGAGLEVLGFEDFRCKKPGTGATGVAGGGGGGTHGNGSTVPNVPAGSGTQLAYTPGMSFTGFNNFGFGLGFGGGTRMTSLVVRTGTATLVPTTDGTVRYRLSGAAYSQFGSGVGYACFQIRSLYGQFGGACDTARMEPLAGAPGDYSFETPPLAARTAYSFRAIAYDQLALRWYWAEEVSFGNAPGVDPTTEFDSSVTSLQKRLEVTFLTNRPEDTNTVSVTSTAGALLGGMSLTVGTLTDISGNPVQSDRTPEVFLDNSLIPATTKALASVPAVTNLRLRFPGSLPSGMYKLPITTTLGNTSEILTLDVVVTNLENSLREQ